MIRIWLPRVLSTVFVIFLLIGLASFLTREFRAADQDAVNVFLKAPTIDQCLVADIQRLKLEKLDGSMLRSLSDNCAERTRQQNEANDALLRRIKFVQQVGDGRVVLWLVVLITFSGVFLAGLQLFASYKLASTGREAFSQSMEFAIEKDKASLKSSVTGLFILIVSFGFFLVFIDKVYLIHEVNVDRGGQTSAASGGLLLGGEPATIPTKKNASP